MIVFKNKLTPQKIENSIFFLFLVIYTSYLLFLSNNLGLGEDESCTISTTANSFLKVIRLSYIFEGQPPAYFIIVALWRRINDGLFFARLLSVVFTLLSAHVLNKILQLIFKKIYSKWVIVMFLLNPFTVWASVEIRLYSLLILLSFIVIHLFYLIYFYNQKNLKFYFVLIGLLGVYTQYYFIFLLISLSILLAIVKGWRFFLNFCLLVIPIAVLFLPNFLYIKDQFVLHNNTQVVYSFLSRLRSILGSPFYFIASSGDLPYGRFWAWLVRIMFISLSLISLHKLYTIDKKQKQPDLKRILEIIIPTIIILLIMAMVYTLSSLIFAYQYMTIAFPFYCLLYILFVVFSKNLKNYIYGIFSIYFIIVLLYTYKAPYIKSVDYKSIVEFVQRTEQVNEPILFHDKSIVMKFKYYYKGNNSLNPLPQLKFDLNFYNDDLKDTLELNQSIEKIYKDSRTILLITGNDIGFTKKKTLTNKMMNCYIENNYIIQIDTTFKGIREDYNIRVRRLSRK